MIENKGLTALWIKLAGVGLKICFEYMYFWTPQRELLLHKVPNTQQSKPQPTQHIISWKTQRRKECFQSEITNPTCFVSTLGRKERDDGAELNPESGSEVFSLSLIYKYRLRRCHGCTLRCSFFFKRKRGSEWAWFREGVAGSGRGSGNSRRTWRFVVTRQLSH